MCRLIKIPLKNKLFDKFNLLVFAGLILVCTEVNISALPAFPGAVGFGTETRHAYTITNNPAICIVTNLTNTSGLNDETRSLAGGSTIGVKTGSFLACIEAQFPRIILFEVSGYITGNIYSRIRGPYCFIAGQTAPSPGITLKATTLIAEDHDIVIQHIRSRVGDDPNALFPDYRDAININLNSYAGDLVYNVVVDHCSLSWGIDENGGGGGAAHDFTWSNNIIAEGLKKSLHSKGEHSKGFMLSGTNVSGIGNFLISCTNRMPHTTRDFRTGVWTNNYCYNSGWFGLNAGGLIDDTFKLSVIGNHWEGGPNSGSYAENYFISWLSAFYNNGVGSEMYLVGNRCDKGIQTSADDWSMVDNRNNVNDISNFKVLSPPLSIPDFISLPVTQVKGAVLANAGARPADRDEVDARLVAEAKSGGTSGRIKDSVEVGTIYFPSGTAEGGTSDSIILAPLSIDAVDDRYNGQTIEITGGTGAGQSREITDWVHSTRTATVEPAWSATPDNTSQYRIANVSTNGAGGWPALATNYREVVLPDNPHNDAGNGYTNLEKWLHKLAAEVEGAEVPSSTDLNQDGRTDIQDIQLCVNIILETETDPDIVARADVNKDGSVNVLDIQEITSVVLER